jgi:adenylate kinase
MRIAVIGPPGSDQEAVATTIAARLNVPTVGITDIVQAEFSAGTSAAIQAKQHMNAGELVPDQVLLSMVRARFTQPDVDAGFVLNGFPNHAVTAIAVDALLSELRAPVDRVIDLVLTDSEVLRRLTAAGTAASAAADGTPSAIPRTSQASATYAAATCSSDSTIAPSASP